VTVTPDPTFPRSPAIEDYAKAIYALERRGAEAVTINALAERLGVTPASASGMVKRLGELGLVEHRPYRLRAGDHRRDPARRRRLPRRGRAARALAGG
jgi:Mn-dependent DtxR family transcriptional regulator